MPDHKPWLVLQGRPGEFYVDHVHPFGASSASSNAGMISNAAVDIWSRKGVGPIVKYEDDITVLRYPKTTSSFTSQGFFYTYDKSLVIHIVSPLHIPWHPEKGTPEFISVFAYIGLQWDFNLKRVSLPEEKRQKHLGRVRSFITQYQRGKCTLLEVQKIHGSLCYISFVYCDGRSRLPSISNFSMRFDRSNSSQALYPPRSMISDLRWWLRRLEDPNIYRDLTPLGPPCDPGFYVDASTSWGIGIILGSSWMAFRLLPNWKDADGPPSRDICWLETVAVEILALILERCNISNARIVIHSDNQGTIGALNKGRSPNYHINMSVRRIFVTFSSIMVAPVMEYIPSSDNPADPISRGELGPSSSRLQAAFQLPLELSKALSYILRPPGPSSSRIDKWSTPFSRSTRATQELLLPSNVLDQIHDTLISSFAPSTRTVYGAGILRFIEYCDTLGISEEDRMPASSLLITAFVSSAAGFYSGSTINTWLSGIRAWHIVNYAPWHGDCASVHMARTTAHKKGSAFQKPKRAPVTLDHLLTLRSQLDLSLSFHAAIWAAVLTAFFGCRRLGEIIVSNGKSFSPTYHITQGATIAFKSLPNNSVVASFHIPWTKTTKQNGAKVILTSRNDILCPVVALQNHLRINKGAPTSKALFAYESSPGQWTHLTKADLMFFVANIWSASSLSAVLGHSFRIGGTVVLLLSGVPPDVVAATGGWTSMAFLTYWRRIEDIVSLSTSNAYSSSDIATLNSVFSNFRPVS
ncbi:hypothetical protein AN958_08946 [Leucoagaricus sp. SymC.cos]|nr:hypothetical protein AN958_08946 [Leucoagaricus sp. SymC.cos]